MRKSTNPKLTPSSPPNDTTGEKICIYEREAPKFDVYTVEIWEKKWSGRIGRRCFASFGNAYSWGMERICLQKRSLEFWVTGENFERTKTYEKIASEGWHRKPFNRMDCDEMTWYFDNKGGLCERLYDYGGVSYEYMPDDSEADAGTHFKPGDLIKCDALWLGKKPQKSKDVVYVVIDVPGRKRDNRWENYYMVLEVTKGDDGSIGTMHTHPHESSIVKYTGPIDKSGPLWFLHQVFAKKTKLPRKQIGDLIDNDLELVDGKWTGIERTY